MSSADESTHASPIDIGGGPTVGGDVNTGGGDFVGRDKNIFTEETGYNVHGLGNPYLGLRAFTYDDRAIYAGREQLAQETVQQLTAPGAQPTLLFITGASGSGKSSFAQAALIPLLETHYAAYQKTVRLAVFRPSSQPMAMLADALQKLHPDLTPATLAANTPKAQINLLLIDQFEELFIQSEAGQRAPFCDFLTHLPSFADCRTHILITLRVDYLDELFAIQPLWAIAKAGVELRTMHADDLRNAIQRPLQVNHPQQRFAPELLDRLVQDAGADAALLPLLQVTLAELWKTGRLVLANYHSLTNAIRQRAEAVCTFHDFDKTDPKVKRPTDEQAELMAILLDLINVSVDGDDRRDVRQRRTRHELAHGSLYRPRLIEELVNARLLAAASEMRNGADVEVIDIIHESLIDNWERLRNAIETQRQQLQRRARFKLWLGEWLRNEQQDGYLLLTSVQLAEVRALDEQNDIELQNPTARNFYRRSVEHQEAEQHRQLQAAQAQAEREWRNNTRLRGALAWIGLLLLAAIGLALVAFNLRNEANTQRRAAVTEKNGAVAARQTAEARRNEAVTAQQEADRQKVAAQRQTQVATARQLAAQASEKLADNDFLTGALLAVQGGRQQSTVETLLALNKVVMHPGPLLATFRHEGVVNGAMWSKDEQHILSWSSDHTVGIWNTASSQRLATLRHDGTVRGAAWSKDEQRILSWDADGSVGVWDATNGQRLATVRHAGTVRGAMWSKDEQHILSWSDDHTVGMWDATSGQRLATLRHDAFIYGAMWSKDEQHILSWSSDNTVRIWDITSGQRLATLRHDASVYGVRGAMWSKDEQHILSWSDGHTIEVWDVASGQLLATFRHDGGVRGAMWSKDEQRILSWSDDGTARLWTIDVPQLLQQVCEIIPRNFTIAEWRVYFGAEPYQPTCLASDHLLGVAKRVAVETSDMRQVEALFTKAIAVAKTKDNVTLTLDPHAQAVRYTVPVLAARASAAVLACKVDEAIALYRQVRALDPKFFPSDPQSIVPALATQQGCMLTFVAEVSPATTAEALPTPTFTPTPNAPPPPPQPASPLGIQQNSPLPSPTSSSP